MEGSVEDEARTASSRGNSSAPSSLNGSAIESFSSEDESKSSLQKSVASYFDRLLQEEREKRKQEQEEQDMKKRLPILLTVPPRLCALRRDVTLSTYLVRAT